jgi:hypothetical protein
MKKGQTATEYLIILAVVIIIALIVVGVMGGIPGMGGGAKTKTSAAYWSTAKVAITSAVVRVNSITFNIRNSNPDAITITKITVDPGTGVPVDIAMAADVVLTPGQTAPVVSGVAYVMPCVAGATYSYKLAITYTENGATYTFTGDGQSFDGTCAS